MICDPRTKVSFVDCLHALNKDVRIAEAGSRGALLGQEGGEVGHHVGGEDCNQ